MSDAPHGPRGPGPAGRGPGVWERRRLRAVECLAQAPHASELLAFYVAVLNEQARVDRRVSGNGPLTPRPWAEPLPEWVSECFSEFVRRLIAVAPGRLADAGEELLGSPDGLASVLAGPWWQRRGPTTEEVDEGSSPAPRFFRAAFLEPFRMRARVGEGGLASEPSGDEKSTPRADLRHCGFCGCRPVVGAVRDEEGTKGARRLVCGACGSTWPYPRATCALCGETDPERLIRHTPAAKPHVSVAECQSCRSYMKEVDLRVLGTAVPVVDEIATPELDLWARDRELTKVTLNLLGM